MKLLVLSTKPNFCLTHSFRRRVLTHDCIKGFYGRKEERRDGSGTLY